MDESLQSGGMMKKKRLMILIWDMGVGGVQKQVRDVVLEINKKYSNWEVYLVIKYQKKNQHFAEEIDKETDTKIYYYSQNHNEAKSWRAMLWVLGLYWRINPDTLLTFLDHLSIWSVILKRLFFWRKTRIVLNEEVITSRYLKINRKYWYIWKILVGVFYRSADIVLVPTNACRNDLLRNFFLPKQKIQVIHNWTLFNPIKEGVRDVDVMYAGRFEPEKNVLDISQIVHRINSKRKLRIYIVGEGSLRRKLIESIILLKISDAVTLMPVQKDIKSYLRRAKILLLPTLNEGLPNIILEAAMCRVPIVSYAFPGVDEIILNEKTGYVVEGIDEAADVIERLLGNEALLERMGIQAQEYVQKRFSYRQQEAYVKVLLEKRDV